jgi:hypothetical protein
MARGYSARESSTPSSGANSRVYASASLTEKMSALEGRIKKSKGLIYDYLYGQAYSMYPLKSRESAANKVKKVLKQDETFFNEANRLIAEGESGNLKGMEPAFKKSDGGDMYGAKMYAARELVAKGIKIGPDRSELTDDMLFDKYKGDTGREHVVSFNKDGKYLLGLTGLSGKILMRYPHDSSEHPLGYTNYKGEDWHNHPRENGRQFGFAPSGSDVAGLISEGLSKRVVGAIEGKYILTVSDEKRAKLDAGSEAGIRAFAKSVSSVWDAAFDAAQVEAGGSGALADPVMAEKFMQTSMKRLTDAASRLGIGFQYIPNKGYERLAT